MNVVSCDLDDKDPFLAADESMALQGLIDETMTGCEHCESRGCVPVCLDACSDTWEEEFFDNLGQEDQGKEQDEETILSLEDIQLFLESRGRLQDAMQVGNFMDNLSAVQIATANRPLFMISFNSNSSLFRVSFNFVNTCYFFVICSFSPKKHHYKENL